MSALIGRASDAVWRRTSGAVLVAGPDHLVTIEGAAALIWELLDEPRSRADLTADLAALHEVSASSISDDIDRSIGSMLQSGIVVEHATPLPAPTTAQVRRRAVGRSVAHDPAAAIAAWGIGPNVQLPDVVVAGWPALLTSIRRERLTGLAFGAARAGDLVLDADQHSELAALHRAAMLVVVRTERLLLDVVDRLDAVGIVPVVHKGPSLAHLAYDDPALRPFGDIDLLVRGHDVDATFAVLEGCGHARRYSEPRPGFDRRFGKGAAFVTPDGLEIDVHRTFASGPFGLTVDLDEVHAGASVFQLGGRDLRVLAPAHQLVAVSMHAALGTRWPRLLNLRDIVQLLRADDLDDARVIETAHRWRVDGAVARALRLAIETFHLDVDMPLLAWAEAHEPARGQRRTLAAYTSDSRSYGRQALAALTVIPGLTAKASYLRAMVLPDRTYEAHRGEHRLARWRRLLRTAVHR